MNESPDDELHALRALNPSTDANAPEELRDRVDAIPHQRTGIQRRAWLAAAAAAVVIGAVGTAFALGPRSDMEVVALTRPAPGEVAPPVELGGGASSDSAGASRDTAELSLGGQTASARFDSMLWGGYWGARQRFIVPAFDRAGGEASVYALDSAPHFTVETLTRAATILGVPGDAAPNEYGGGWTVGPNDGTGPTISLSSWGRSDLWYYSGSQGPVWACVDQAIAPDYGNWTDVHEECLRTTPTPTEQQARDAMSTVLDAFGIDPSTMSVEILDADLKFENTLTARASRVVDDMATPLSIQVTVSYEGILTAGGSIGDVVSLGSYRIVSPAEAAERLNVSAFSPDLSYVEPTDVVPMLEVSPDPPSAPAPVPAAGSTIPWSVAQYEIVSARLGMSAVYGADGVVYVVPAYEFTDSLGNRWSVIALAEESLDLSTAQGW